LVKKYKPKSKEEIEKIKEEIKKLKEEKARESIIIKQEEEKKRTEAEAKAKAEAEKKQRNQEEKAISKSVTQKITLLGLRKLSYKDLENPKKDTFDPKILIADDDNDDEEYKQIMKKFEIIKEEPPKERSKRAQGVSTSKATHKSIQDFPNSRRNNSNAGDESVTSLKASEMKVLR